jgi:hypothetical protein
VTNSFDPKAPKSSRKKHKREPATIDLKATVVSDAPRPNETRPGEETPEPAPVAEDAAAAPTATLDSGAGVDSIEAAAAGPGAPGDMPPTDMPVDMAPAAEIPGQDVPAQETAARVEPGQDTLPGIQDTLPGAQDTLADAAPASDASSADMPPRAEPAPRSHVGALIGSGLLGGLIGAGLLYGVQEWRGAPAGDDPRLVQLEQRVGALAQQRSTPGQPAADGALEGRIAALESATATFDQRLQAAQGAAEQAGVRATEALNRPAPPQNDAAVTELSERVTRMDEQVRGNQQQIQQVQSGLQPVPQVQSGLQQVQADLQQVRSELQAGAQARQAAEGRVADLDRRLSEQDRRLSEQDRRAGEQEGRLADLSRQVTATTEATTQPAIRVILAERLGTALRNGAPYTDVLAALRNAETEPARLSALEPFAQQGAPTAAELAQDFGPLGARILQEERPADAAWTDRLLRMADKVVTVRPVNAPETAGVTGLVGRIEQALGRGDVAAAVTAWEALPEPSRRLSEEWGRQAKARAEADAAAQAIVSDAVAALNTRTTQ